MVWLCPTPYLFIARSVYNNKLRVCTSAATQMPRRKRKAPSPVPEPEKNLREDFLKDFDDKVEQYRKEAKTTGTTPETLIQKHNSMFRTARCTVLWTKPTDTDIDSSLLCVHDALQLLGLWERFKESGLVLPPAGIDVWAKGFQTLYISAKDDANRAEFVTNDCRHRTCVLSPVNHHLSSIVSFVHPQGGKEPSSVWEEGTDERPFLWHTAPGVWNALTLYMETKHKSHTDTAAWQRMMEAQMARYQQRLRDASPPGCSVLAHVEVLAMIVERLPLPSAGRLATVCVWLRGHITSRQLINIRDNARARHGLYSLAGAKGITLRSLNDGVLKVRIFQYTNLLRVEANSVAYVAEASAGMNHSRPVELIRRAIECKCKAQRQMPKVWFKEGAQDGDGRTDNQETSYFQIFVHLSEEEKYRFTLTCVPVAML